MPKKLQKSFQDYLNKIKHPTQNIQLPSTSFSSSKNWILSGCKHPKTLSFAIDHNRKEDHEDGDKKDEAATLSDIDRFLFENFRSLYTKTDEEDHQRKVEEGEQGQNPNGILFDQSPLFGDPPPDLCGSHRFFVARGSSSGSLIEEARFSLTTTSEEMRSSSASTNTINDSTISSNEVKNVRLPDDSIAVLTYSPNPYHDFRRSMQEMVEERLQNKGKVDWDFMEELLICYLNLNEKKSHKFILSAFVDLIIGLRQNSSMVPERSRHSQIARKTEGRN